MKTDLELVKDFCIALREKANDLMIDAYRDGSCYAIGSYKGQIWAYDTVIDYVESIEHLYKVMEVGSDE